MYKYSFLFVTAGLLFSCAGFKTYQSGISEKDFPVSQPYHSVFLVGNSNLADKQLYPSAALLEKITAASRAKDQTILMLGNNLSASKPYVGPEDSLQTGNLDENLDFFKHLNADMYFVSGEREWNNGKKNGWNKFSLIEDHLEDMKGLGNIVRPDNGCPGPEEIDLGDDVVLLLINTQWLFHEWERPETDDGCEVSNEIEFYNSLEDAIKRNYNKKIIVAGHHSLFSSGLHAGFFPPKAHIFPLTPGNENLYVPLPIIGSAYLGFRKLFGEHEDIQNYEYKRFRKNLLRIFAMHKNLIYTSAHEHSLEFFDKQNNFFINSGSFAQAKAIGDNGAEFATATSGFARVDFYDNGDVWLSFWSPEKEESPIYCRLLFSEKPFRKEEFEEAVASIDYSDSTKSTFITKDYLKKSTRTGALGQNYREEWAATVKGIPYFDIGKEKGGLKIDKKGGGMQTKSLRLEAKNGKEYVLRSMEKFPENAVPVELRGTFAENLIAEQISAAQPYAAFAIPKLADAAGIYHTNPKLVYLPDDPRLGIYRENFGGALYLFEERPDDDRSDVESFGRSKDIISTEDVIKKMHKDGDHTIDQKFVVRSRLFDMLIGDWDRHEDQWRWAKFKEDDDIKLYRPIPRDRDNAFFWSDGWFMALGTHKWGLPKFQGFHKKIRDVEGFNFNARYFDRTFMNEPELEDWLKIAKDLQISITDDVIESAIREMPPEIFALHGEDIIEKLKTRRDDLQEYAKEYYLFLAKSVDIVGTKKNDLFTIERMDDQRTKVTGYTFKEKSGEIKYKTYERVFRTSETKEIRIYGLNDGDIFRLGGDVNNGIKVRIIGGSGNDLVDNESNVRGLQKKTVVYDKKNGLDLRYDYDTRDKTSDKPEVNEYNRKNFQYDLIAPLVYGGYNPDDGLFIGLGTLIKTHGFRKDPFKTSHFIVGNIAPKSASFNISYKGTFTNVLGKWSLHLNSSIFYPSYSDFFYGFGNETDFNEELQDKDVRYYAARYQQIKFNPELFNLAENEQSNVTLGASYQLLNVKENRNDDEGEERFIHSYVNSAQHTIFDDWRQFLSTYVQYDFDSRNSKLYPMRGLHFQLKTGYTADLDDNDYNVSFSFTQSQLSFYYTFGNTFRTTLALRGGGAINEGDYEFYQANTIGGSENMRGYRKQRFAGDRTLYQNTDLRIRLFSFRSIVFPGDAGLVLFHDFGRVWMDNDPSVAEKSDLWHQGYGIGFFIAPFKKGAVTMDYSRSNTSESAIFVRLGFLF